MDLGNRFVIFIFGRGSRIYSRISIKGFSVKDQKTKRLHRTHNFPPNSVSVLHVKNMDVIPGQKRVRMDQIKRGLLVARHIQNVGGQKVYNSFQAQILCEDI
jgi:hypothetical protein